MITFLGDVALIDDNLQSEYKPENPYVFNLEYVVRDAKTELLPTLGKINLSSSNYAFENVFGKHPVAVDIVNNHIYDYGEKGFQKTTDKLQELEIIGISDTPVFINEKLCLFAFMLFEDNNLFKFEYKKAKDNIQKAKNINPDVRIVVQMHWGIENSSDQTDEQKKVGHWLIDNGADLVIGHHPHCLQPAEQYKGKMIFYSLGNTLFGNINTPSHYDRNYIPKRIYRFKWQYWNRKSIAVNYDEERNVVYSIDYLYQRKNKLICKKQNLKPEKICKSKRKKSKIKFLFRKYFLFFASNIFVDGKLFDLSAVKHELRGKK